jgi:ElaB/YqjD/DUF883 family membrane-anchored ribosome-binding protein
MTGQRTPEELRREIEQTRRELGETVDALSHKADVKEQARIKAGEVQERVSENPQRIAMAIGGMLGLLLLLRVLRRR